MKLDEAIFLVAVLILWTPSPSLSERARQRSLLGHYSTPDFRQVLHCWQNHVDWIRAVLGAYVIARTAPEVRFDLIGLDPRAIWIPGLILGIGVLFQTVRLPLPPVIVAPVFYLSGLTMILPGWLESVFALAFGWAFAIATKDVRHQLPAMGFALLLAGAFNYGLDRSLLLSAGCVLAPPVLALLLNRRLVFPTVESRYARRRAASQAPPARAESASDTLGEPRLSPR